jgi:hypothetical protein
MLHSARQGQRREQYMVWSTQGKMMELANAEEKAATKDTVPGATNA